MDICKLFLISIFVILFGSIFACKSQGKEGRSFDSKVNRLTKNTVLGKFDYTKHADFIRVPANLSSKKIYLQKEVVKAFEKMANQAKKEGISLKIISGTRNFSHQKRIWERKWKKYKSIAKSKRALKILEFSSMPCTSRHHWGTDMDINSLKNSYFKNGKGKKEYDWLVKNAKTYGFYQVYTSKDKGRTGYKEEKWHWSYAPLSSIYLDFYNKNVTYKDVNGFKGYRFASKIEIIKNYVNGINSNILNYKNGKNSKH